MPRGTIVETVPASAADVFRLLHDYSRRLEWDTMLQEARLTNGFQAAGLNATCLCKARRNPRRDHGQSNLRLLPRARDGRRQDGEPPTVFRFPGRHGSPSRFGEWLVANRVHVLLYRAARLVEARAPSRDATYLPSRDEEALALATDVPRAPALSSADSTIEVARSRPDLMIVAIRFFRRMAEAVSTPPISAPATPHEAMS